MEQFTLRDEFIELNKLLKLMGVCESGGDANQAIAAGEVRVDGRVETRKRNKIMAGMSVEARGRTIRVAAAPGA